MDSAKQRKSAAELKEEIIRLGPWHQEVQVTPEISTRVFLDAPEGTYSGAKDASRVSFVNVRDYFVDEIGKIYPEGLAGRSFLECACNCGAYCFWAKELGASRCFGFDVREHWIDQARFLAENRTVGSSEGVSFEVSDLYDLPKLGLEPFDVTLFSGIFYHLPDPITGLKAAADLTNEVLILSTAARNDHPDGLMVLAKEGTEQVMTGVHGLNWFPTGPKVVERILNWMGFPETKVVLWNRSFYRKNRNDIDRIRIIASRKRGLLKNFESMTEPVQVGNKTD